MGYATSRAQRRQRRSRRRSPALPAGAGRDALARADRDRHVHRRRRSLPHQRDLAASFGVSHRGGPRGARAAGRRRPRARALGTGHVRHRPARGGAALPRLGRRADGRRGARPRPSRRATSSSTRRPSARRTGAPTTTSRGCASSSARWRDAGDDLDRLHLRRPRAAPGDRRRGPQPPAGRRAGGAAPRAARHGRDRRPDGDRGGLAADARRGATPDLVEAVAAQDLGGAAAAMDAMLDRLRIVATDRGLMVSERLTIWRAGVTLDQAAERIYRIPSVLHPRRFAQWLVVGDDRVLLVDSGVDGTIAEHVVPALGELGLEPRGDHGRRHLARRRRPLRRQQRAPPRGARRRHPRRRGRRRAWIQSPGP